VENKSNFDQTFSTYSFLRIYDTK